jgi:class 3 adenylate cyclase
MPFVETLATKYARTPDGRYVAYQITGQGPRTLLATFGHGISVEDQLEGRLCRQFIERLGAFSRVMRFDRSGTGLSDPVHAIDHTAWERWVEDAVAVMDAAGVESVDVAAVDMTAGPMSMMLAASRPDRVSRLVLFNGTARWRRAPDYPWGMSEEEQESFIADMRDEWMSGESPILRAMPSIAHDEEFTRWWLRARRRGMSPSVAEAVYRNGMSSDFRAILPTIRVPTLVLLRGVTSGDRVRYVAEHIPDARLVEVPGSDMLVFVGESEAVAQEIEEFLTGTRSEAPTDRVLATVLFTDVASSTEHASRLGDRAWRERLDAHDAMVRELLGRFRGREIKTTGDGFLATFDGPARAINCAGAITKAAHQLGIEIRAGLHTGEIEQRGDDIGGLAVHIGARVVAKATAGEVLVSRTVVDLVAGSGINFLSRGEHVLKGVDGRWQLFAVAAEVPTS